MGRWLTCKHGAGYWEGQESNCIVCRNIELEAEVKRPQTENDSWEETVNAMLRILSVKRRGTAHGPVEAVQNTVSSYEGENTNLKAEVERLRREKRARVYYQDIVYAVCRILDAVEGRDLRHGEGIVCGTLETPERGVQEAMSRVAVDFQLTQADLQETKNLLELANEGLPMDSLLWDAMKKERDEAKAKVERLQGLITKLRLRFIGPKTPHPAQWEYRKLWDEMTAAEGK